MTQRKIIDWFGGPNRFLSNFYPCCVMMDGDMYETVEHAFQAAKTDSPEHRSAIQKCTTPGAAKRMGRRVPLRADWDDARIGVMRDLLRRKFSDHELQLKLLGTGDAELIEGNNWSDFFWGVCDGRGENHLGKLLMEVRDEIRDAQ